MEPIESEAVLDNSLGMNDSASKLVDQELSESAEGSSLFVTEFKAPNKFSLKETRLLNSDFDSLHEGPASSAEHTHFAMQESSKMLQNLITFKDDFEKY